MTNAYYDLMYEIMWYQRERINNPVRTVMEFKEHEASAQYIPRADTSEDRATTKVVTIFPKNPQVNDTSAASVSDASNGEHISVMNTSYLTRFRTGTLSAIRTNKLAQKNTKALGIISTDSMVFEQVLAVLKLRPIDQIVLYNPMKEKRMHLKNG